MRLSVLSILYPIFLLFQESIDAIKLANSSWPISHHNIQQRDCTLAKAPNVRLPLKKIVPYESTEASDMSNPIQILTLPPKEESKDELRMWASGLTGIGLLSLNLTSFEVSTLDIYQDDTLNGTDGAYSFVTDDGAFYAVFGQNMNRFEFVEDEEKIKVTKSLSLQISPEESLKGTILMKYDDVVIVVSTNGLIIAADVQLTQILHVLDLKIQLKDNDPRISNGFSVDENGIFVVTQRDMVRVNWNKSAQKLHFKWSYRYYTSKKEQPYYPSRLGPGSGSTPSITTCFGKSYVVITDGELPMNLLYINAHSGKLAAKTHVDFENNLNTTSEQSVAVRGCSAFVVNNFIGETLEDVQEPINEICEQIDGGEFHKYSCPVYYGVVSYGAARFVLNLDSNNESPTIAKVWNHPNVSCSTAIPVISKTSNSVLCMGKKNPDWGLNDWGLMGMDWNTGELLLNNKFRKTKHFPYNPAWADTEIIADDVVASGVTFGIAFMFGYTV